MLKQQAEYDIAIPVAISKEEMGSTAQWIGFVNAGPVESAGVTYALGTLRFLGFFGAFDLADRLFRGDYRLASVPVREQSAEICDMLDIQSLPGMTHATVAELPIASDKLPPDEEGE